jgi:hypothetical protein
MTDAAQHLADEPRVSADMRYRINAFGHELVGTGRYLQLSAGAEKLVRLELRVQVGEKTATVKEIRGLDTFWVRRDVPPAVPTLGRVDLKQLRRSLATGAEPKADVLPQGDWIMLGGLARLMLTLEESFDFAPPRSEELQFNAPEGKGVVRLPIWRMDGKWKPQRLAALLGHKLKAGEALPEQLPDRVELVLGRNEEVLALFPYRITYWKTPPTDLKSNAPAPEPQEMLMLELFNVSRRPIDSREFDYQPGDQHYDELTPQYAQRLGGETKTR